MAKAETALSGEELVYGYVAEYLDEELPSALAVPYREALARSQDVPPRYQKVRGRLQLAMSRYLVKEEDRAEIRSLVQDPAATMTQENVRIEQIGRGEVVATLLRRFTLGGIAVAIIAGLVWRFGPRPETRFKPLEYLGYEALALEQDAREHLNLPTRDLSEVTSYLQKYPGLEFKPVVLGKLPGSWQLDGATVFDYDIARVAAIEYSNGATKEKLFHFSFGGALSELPRAEKGNIRGLIFQTYASDQLNLIAWDSGNGVLSLLVGRRSAPELAELAVAGLGK